MKLSKHVRTVTQISGRKFSIDSLEAFDPKRSCFEVLQSGVEKDDGIWAPNALLLFRVTVTKKYYLSQNFRFSSVCTCQV